jgi:predicted HTH transcriptional regulator
MSLRHIPLDKLAEEHLTRLIEGGLIETRDIEYKAITYGTNDDAKREFLANISSFANAAGGDLVIGIRADAGIATEIVPLSMNVDDERTRLESIARDGLEPRILGLGVQPVIVSQGHVIVIRIPKSYNPPHRVVYKNSNRFHVRGSGGRYEPRVDELRDIFTRLPYLADRVRDWRRDRLTWIRRNEPPTTLTAEANTTLADFLG